MSLGGDVSLAYAETDGAVWWHSASLGTLNWRAPGEATDRVVFVNVTQVARGVTSSGSPGVFAARGDGGVWWVSRTERVQLATGVSRIAEPTVAGVSGVYVLRTNGTLGWLTKAPSSVDPFADFRRVAGAVYAAGVREDAQLARALHSVSTDLRRVDIVAG